MESADFPPEILLCADCQKLLAGAETSRCPRCGSAVSSAGPQACADCQGRELRFDGVLPLGSYKGDLRECVLKLKRPGHESLAVATAGLLYARHAEQLGGAKVDAVLPVPMHWARRLVRRANNAELLAATLATRLRAPMLHRAMRRVRNTRKQGPMLRTERLQNVRGAFRLAEDVAVQGKKLLVVDDVLTTGATCDEIAKTLKRAGATTVTIAVLARADSAR
jgi:ComF family protein